MTTYELKELICELRNITNPAVFKDDEQYEADKVRSREILKKLGMSYADDVFEKYGKYGQLVA